MSSVWKYLSVLWFLLAIWKLYDHELVLAMNQGLLALLSLLIYTKDLDE